MLAASRKRKGELTEILSEQLGSATPLRALVVEANPCDLTHARIALLEQGFTVMDTALSLRQAFELAKSHVYQVILVDYFLPDGDGMELLEWMDDESDVIMLAGHTVTGHKYESGITRRNMAVTGEALAM
jgi:CheY-like chemotaxis protein